MRQLAKYTADNGNEITLTDNVIRSYLCDNERVTDKEVMLFAALCKGQNLDPFNREAYLVKYGGKPATMIVSKDVFVKRAQANPKFRGFQAGLNIITADGSRLIEREGSLLLNGETLVGGWCRVFIEGYEQPMFDSVSFSEYSTGKSNWASKPATMIRKVAIVHALREAFPSLGGMYEASEMGTEDIPSAKVERVAEVFAANLAEDAQPWGEPAYIDNENVIAEAEFKEVSDEEYAELLEEF